MRKAVKRSQKSSSRKKGRIDLLSKRDRGKVPLLLRTVKGTRSRET